MRLRFFALALLAAVVGVRAQEPSPYFPERGAGALHQRSLELTKPVVVLSLALEPGYEDLNTLASLRLGAGARIVCAYATNGATTRSDINGDPPSLVAACRREEAFRAIALLGGETHFLNLPEFGVVSGAEGLGGPWQADSLAKSVVALLRTYKPDLVLLPPDFRETDRESPRVRRLRDAIVSAVTALGRREAGGDSRREARPLHVRCAEERGDGSLLSPVDIEGRHPIWNRSYREIGTEARRAYRSLRVQAEGWNTGRKGTYTLLTGRGGKEPRTLTDGLPVLGKRMTALAAAVARSVEKAGKESGPRALATLAGTIRQVEKFFLERQLTLTGTERRVVAAWRVGLDNLRCSIMRVEISLEMSDSLMTERQVLTLKCTGIEGAFSRDSVKILFPSAIEGSWTIDESSTSEFPLTVNRVYRILTPRDLAMDLPGSMNAFSRTMARKKFPVVVIHEDRDWTRNFAYRRDFLLRAGPRRSLEVLTPVVRVIAGERLVLRFQNFSHDPFRGEVTVNDSLVRGARDSVWLPTRDYVSRDTLHLAWTDDVRPGDHIVEAKIARKTVARFLARKFSAEADTSLTVGLITGLENSPVAETLRRMHVPVVALERIPGTAKDAGGLQVIVMDRDALSLRSDLRPRLGDLESWVRAGGRLVILPQTDDRPAPAGVIGGIRFSGGAMRPVTAPVVLETGSRMLAAPNRITQEDFEGWIIARTLGGFVLPADADVQVHVRDTETGTPLAASLTLGAGSITVTNLDLLPQMSIVHPGSFRLLGNMLSLR